METDLVLGLRAAADGSANASARTKALDTALELLVSTTSLATTQLIVSELTRLGTSKAGKLSRQDLLARLKQAAAVCATPASKAEYLGFALTQQSFHCLEDPKQRMQHCQETLIDCFNSNPHVLSGVLAAVESRRSPLVAGSSEGAQLALQVISPLFVRIFIGADESCQTKLALLHVLQRVAWQSSHAHTSHAVTRVLVAALERTPRRADSVQSYIALVAAVVDLLVASSEEPTTESTRMIRGVCEHIVARARFFAAQQVGVLQLLQLLAQLAEFAPDALWCSRFLFACAHLLATTCDASLERQLLLESIASVLAFGRDHDVRPTRGVYVECLVVPLISVLTTHAETASPQLQLAMSLCARSRFSPPAASPNSDESAPEDDESVHLHSILRLVADSDASVSWLATLFAASPIVSSDMKTGARTSEESWLSLVLGTLLFDERRALRESAVAALERQVCAQPKFWSAPTTKLLVSSLVFLASHRPKEASAHYPAFLSRSLLVLASLAAGTTDTMKIVLRLIKRMSAVASMRATALRLLFVVWERESRVYPRLEALLHNESADSDPEYDVVKVATIAALCERDPELGVEYVSQIQSSLEDARVSVVAMAVNAIAALCRADCLDFYAAFKILALKLKKKKVACAAAPLFLERLCVFYALGAAEIDANRRQADKLLEHLWELAESNVASVRCLAYESLNAYSLQALGLCVSEPRGAAANGDDDDDDDEVTEEDVGEKLDELVESLRSEDADAVRTQIEKLLTRVLERESAKLTSGSGRGQAAVSSTVDSQRLQQRVSAAATREVKKKFASRREVAERYSDERGASVWDAFLITYEEKEAVEYSSVKRKDKLVKLATQNVVDMEVKLSAVLARQAAPWDSGAAVDTVFLRVQSLMKGWQAFMAKYVDAVDELSSLKLTIGANPEDGDEFFVNHMNTTLASLQKTDAESGREQLALVAVGALVGQLRDCKRWASPHVVQCVQEQIRRTSSRLKRVMEEAKVFAHEHHHATVVSAVVELHLSLGHRAFYSKKEAISAAHLGRLEVVLLTLLHEPNHALVQAVAATAVSHWVWLCACSKASGDRLSLLATVQTRVETVARSVLSMCLRSVIPDSLRSTLVNRVFSDERVSSVDTHAMVAPAPTDVVVMWGSLMGLARVLSGFARIERVRWLTNLKDVLTHVWRQSADAGVFGVALGPAVLECVRFNLASAAEAEAFVRTSIERLETCGSALDKGFRLLAACFVLGHLPAISGAAPHAQLQALVIHAQSALRDETQPELAHMLALAGIANYFQSSLGIRALGAGPTHRRASESVQLVSEASDVEALVECVRAQASGDNEFAQFVLGAIAVVSELFFVAQKKRSFDAEVSSLPPKSLLSKSMELLRREQTGGAAGGLDDRSRARLVRSLLSCLTATSAALPLLDFESPVHRLMKRFCDVDVTVACVQFALTQGICDVYVIDQLYAPEALANLSPRVQRELISGVPILAARVASDTLDRVVTTVADVVLADWHCGMSSDERRDVLGTWIDALATLLECDSGARISPESRDVVKRVVVEQILPHVPFADPSDTESVDLVRRFAREVLSRIPRHDGVEAFVLSSSSTHGAQHAAMLAELLRSGVVFAAEKQTAVVAQWVARQDFSQWAKASVATRVQLLHELSSFVSLVGPDGKPSQDPISWLLEVVHAFSHAVTARSALGAESAAKRHALFTFVASVCGWQRSLSFERHIALRGSSPDSSVSPFVCSFSVGLLSEFGASESVRAVVEQLWALQPLVQDASADLRADAIDYDGALRAFARHAHIVAGARATQSVRPSVLQFWSVDGFQ